MRRIQNRAWMIGVASAALALAAGGSAHAQEAASAEAAAIGRNEPQSSEEVVVLGAITYRNRVETPAPVLEYGLDYFQRFEPLTVGDMLKRTPSTAFLSDVLEYDGVRLRGLDPGYTQILINGDKVPGQGDDRSFFVDRIPAELVERVEIVRSPSANRSGDAMAGALNIVLRDAYALEGGYARAGGLHFNDGEWKPTLGGVYGGAIGGARILIGANLQGRYNPKEKLSDRYGEPPASAGSFDNREYQSDVRDGTDYSFNGSLTAPVGQGELELSGFFVRTEREESELSREFASQTSQDNADLLSVTPQYEDITQDNYALRGRLDLPMMGGETQFRLGYARFKDDVTNTETEFVYEDGDNEFESVREITDSRDADWSARLSHERDLDDATLEFGADYSEKDRDADIRESEIEGDIDDPSPPLGDLGDALGQFEEFEAIDGGLYSIEERRFDPFIMLSRDHGALNWEMGVRYETTEVDITDEDGTTTNEYKSWLPSAHARIDLTEADRLSLSFGRTLRRPNFNFLAPATLGGEFGDNDFRGNPRLKPESAWGIDLGFEHRIGRAGVMGINFFYRDVKDVIELFNTGEASEEYQDAVEEWEEELEEFLEDNPSATEADFDEHFPELNSFVFSARNTGDGKVWGVEFDLSTPLTFMGLEDTGVFLNYSWLDSEISDELGERRFNDQAESVLNVGFIQDVPSWAAAFGATYREQGDAFSRVLAEEVATSYGADLEVFVEKRVGERLTVRLTGSNLLDASKDEVFNKFDTLGDQISRDFDEYEIETESSGPVFQLVGRMAF